MNQSYSSYSTHPPIQAQQDKAMTNEQFEQIVDAILAGKYSWACVLILRSAGYNPLHYIPYRTYNRLIKDNCLNKNSTETDLNRNSNCNFEHSKKLSSTRLEQLVSSKSPTKIKDLKYLEELDRQEIKIKGGFRQCQWGF